MNIRQQVLHSIYAGEKIRFAVHATRSGVSLGDAERFIPLSELCYSSEIGYYALGEKELPSECPNENPEKILPLADGEGGLYVWMDGDGYPHLLGELHQCADLYQALGEFLSSGITGPAISPNHSAWGRCLRVTAAVEEALAGGVQGTPVQVAHAIRAAARRGAIRDAMKVDGEWAIPVMPLRSWIVRNRTERRGRPRK
jgi:hypothetical protein